MAYYETLTNRTKFDVAAVGDPIRTKKKKN